MALRVLREFDGTTSSITIPVSAGHYSGFQLDITGTTAAAQELLTNEDLGYLTVYVGQVPVIYTSVTMALLANMRWYGAPPSVTPTAGATYIGCYIPATPDFHRLPNSFYARRDGDIQIQWTRGSAINTTQFAALSGVGIQVYADQSYFTPAFFVPRWQSQQENLIVGQNALQLPVLPGITDVFARIASGTGVVNRVYYQPPNGLPPHESSLLAAWTKANIMDNVELTEVLGGVDTVAQTPDYIHLIPGEDRTMASLAPQGGQLSLNVITSTATAEVLYVGGQLLGDTAIESAAIVRANLDNVLRQIPATVRDKFVKALTMASGGTREQAINNVMATARR